MTLTFTDELESTNSYTYANDDLKSLKKELTRWLNAHENCMTPLYKIEIDFTASETEAEA